MKYLITGGCGFIGANYIDHILETDKSVTSVVIVDKMTSISNEYIQEKYMNDDRVNLSGLYMDIANKDWVSWASVCSKPDIVVHFAAESHVDRSCEDVLPSVRSNVQGTANVANFCMKVDIPMIYISTDEVYGSLGLDDEAFTEESPHQSEEPICRYEGGGGVYP